MISQHRPLRNFAWFVATRGLSFAVIGAIGAISVISGAQAAPIPAGKFLVVLDPGHGGADHGTIYRDGKVPLAEKDLTLLLALQTAEALKRRGVAVRLTRTRDENPPLPERTRLANRWGAKLFLSIHLNSSHSESRGKPGVTAGGIETFILNHSSDASSERLAKLENSVLPGSPTLDHITFGSAHSEVALILKELRLDANLAESKRLACLVQGALTKRAPETNRGVKQGLFYVLLGADMPSALVEAGFLSSPQDRSKLLSSQGQAELSESLARAINLFRLQRTVSSCKVL